MVRRDDRHAGSELSKGLAKGARIDGHRFTLGRDSELGEMVGHAARIAASLVARDAIGRADHADGCAGHQRDVQGARRVHDEPACSHADHAE